MTSLRMNYEGTLRIDYERMTVPQLRERARVLGITGRWDMTKKQLIASIKEVDEKEAESKVDNKEASYSKTDSNNGEIAKVIEYDIERRMKFVENVSVGSIVAVRCFNAKVKSAKVIAKDEESRTLEVETNYGRKFSVRFEDVVWVRAGSRWPKGILQLLKSKSAI